MINKNIFYKTKQSLIKINIYVVVSFLIIFSIFIILYFKGLSYSSIDKNLKEELKVTLIQLKNTSFYSPIVRNDPSNIIYIYEKDRIRYYTPNGYFENTVPKMRHNKDTFFTFKENGYTFRELNIIWGDYTIRIIRNIDSEMNSSNQLIFVFIIGIILAIVITYFVALYLTKRALIPIENAWNNQAQFIQDASHELRTPVTIVSSKLESMLKYPNNTIGDEVETIADAMSEVRRVKKMINDLLSLTKEESITKLYKENINIIDLLDELSNKYIDIAQIQGKDFITEFDLSNKFINTDKNKLIQLLIIFIDNAFKYTNFGDFIKINVYQIDKDNINISIMDSGIGIKEDEINNIFDRFFRSENVRNKDIDGSGIGLSIAKMLSLNLGINISVNSKLNKGTVFNLTIPKK